MIVMKQNKHNSNKIFEKNLKLLPGFIKQQIQNIKLEDVWKKVEVVYNEQGYPLCKYKLDDEFIHINSREPLAQAEHWSKQVSLAKLRTLFVYGCGFGYPLIELSLKKHQESIFIIFEQDIYLFVVMLHYFDLEPLLKTNQFVFFIGDFVDFSQDFHKFISSPNLFYVTVPSVVFTPSLRILQKKYIEIQEHIYDRLKLHIKSLGNDHYDSLIGFHHMIENAQEVLENPYLSSLKDKYKNIPAFIIANGPSLDQQMEELIKVKGKGLLLCCGTAIVPLMKHGIHPDALFVQERPAAIYHQYFEDKNYPDDISLLALSVVDPRIFSTFKGPRVPIFRTETNSQFMNLLIGDGNGFFCGSSVAHFAFEAAVYMGANPIVLVGQDLAYDSTGMTHSRDSHYVEEQLHDVVDKIKLEPTVYVESNDATMIPTNQTWYNFKLTFEQLIEQHLPVTVINTTERGAKIKGTVCEKLADVIGEYCKDNLPYRINTLITMQKESIDVQLRKDKLINLIIVLNKYIEIYRSLEQLASYRRWKCEQLLELIEYKGITVVKEEVFQEYKKNLNDMNKFFSRQLHVSYFQQVILVANHKMNGLGPISSPLYLREALEIQFVLFDQLNTICQSLVRNFQIALEKLSSIELKIENE